MSLLNLIRKLQYVIDSRLDIALVIGIVAKKFENPRENHLMAVKRIMRYLKGTNDFGLYYKTSEKFELNTYTDVEWEGTLMIGKAPVEEHSS